MKIGNRPCKPAAVKVAEGRQKSKIQKDPEVSRPDSPAEIPIPSYLNEIGAPKFQHLAKLLADARILTNADFDALGAWCRAYQNFYEASKQMEGQPLIIESTKGTMMQHPFLAVLNRASEAMRMWSQVLGLDPVSRARLGTKGELEGDDMAMWLARQEEKKLKRVK